MLSNATWFYKEKRLRQYSQCCRGKRKLVLLSLCVYLSLLWKRGRHSHSSLAYCAFHIRIKHFKKFGIQLYAVLNAQLALTRALRNPGRVASMEESPAPAPAHGYPPAHQHHGHRDTCLPEQGTGMQRHRQREPRALAVPQNDPA